MLQMPGSGVEPWETGVGGVCAQEAYVLKGWDRNKHTGDRDVNRVKNRWLVKCEVTEMSGLPRQGWA